MSRCNFCGNKFKKECKNSNIFEQLICPKCAKDILKKKFTLGIGVLHFKENEETILKSLKSIDKQKGFDFKNLRVIVVTDGGGIKLDENIILPKLKNIKPTFIYKKENSKCGGTRNTIIQKLLTDYIMFLDSDDKLASKKVLKRVYEKTREYKPDIYCSAVLEEQYNGRWKKYKNLMCLNMCHGKAFKREALLHYDIWFNPTVLVGEDLIWLTSLYDVCDNIYYDSDFVTYKWLFNKNSITRNTGVDIKLDSYYRCFEPVMRELNDWYLNIRKNKFVNEKFVSMMYNIFYYRIMLTTKGKTRKEYLRKFFNYIITSKIDFDLTDKLDKRLNRHLLKHVTKFKKSYKKYKENK